jgi:hypothetical protein
MLILLKSRFALNQKYLEILRFGRNSDFFMSLAEIAVFLMGFLFGRLAFTSNVTVSAFLRHTVYLRCSFFHSDFLSGHPSI